MDKIIIVQKEVTETKIELKRNNEELQDINK